MHLDKVELWSSEYSKNKEEYNQEVPLVYATPHVLVHYLDWDQEREEYTLLASSDEFVSEAKYQGTRYIRSQSVSLKDPPEVSKCALNNSIPR
jgi:hypothetical protein